MIMKRPSSCFYLFFRMRRAATTCTIPVDPPNSSNPTASGDHKSLCLSLAEQLIQRGLVSSAQQVIRRLIGQSGSISDAIMAFDFASRRGLDLDLGTYGALIRKLVSSGEPQLAELLYSNKIVARGINADPSILNSMVICSCKLGKLECARNHFDRLLSFNCAPYKHTCDSILREFSAQERFFDAFDYFLRICDIGAELSFWCINLLMDGLCHRGHIDEALQVFDISCNRNPSLPTVHSYTLLISALYKQNRIREADELVENMLERGVIPDHLLFLTLIKHYPKGCELQLAFTILQAIAVNGCGFDSSTMSTFSSVHLNLDLEKKIELLLERIVRSNLNLADIAYAVFICALCEEGKVNEALVYFYKMVDLGFRPLLFIYNSIIKGLCQLGLFEDANSVIALMQDHGMFPDQATYLVMVNELCNQGDLVSVNDILKHMEEREMRPNVAIYNSVIRFLCKEKRIVEAEDMFGRMLQSGVDPDEAVYTTMINGYAITGRATEALQLFDKMIENSIKPTSHSYTAVISGLMKNHMTEKGCTYLGRMLEDGILPNAVLYSSLIKHFFKNGEFGYAFRLVDLMDKNQLDCDLVTCIIIAGGLCRYINGTKNKSLIFYRQSEKAKEMLLHLLHQNPFLPIEKGFNVSANSPEEMTCCAMKLMQRIKGVAFMPNLYLYNCLISGFCRAERIQDAYNHFQMMQKEGVQPNQVTYTILMGRHIQSHDIDSAVRLFNKMNADGCAPDRMAYNTLLKGFVLTGRLLDAMSLVYTMQKRGLNPNKLSYEKLLAAFCNGDFCVYAFRIFEEMLAQNYKPCRYNHNWLLYILCKSNRLHEARTVFDMMLQRGITLNSDEERVLMSAWSKLYGLPV